MRGQQQEDERIELENTFMAQATRALPREQVQVAVDRNYAVASDQSWKRLMMQTLAEQERVLSEIEVCTFRPKLVAKAPDVSSRYLLPVPQQPKQAKPPNGAVPRPTKAAGSSRGSLSVYERLYRESQEQPKAKDRQQRRDGRRTTKRLPAASIDTFVGRQEADQRGRQQLQAHLAAKYRYPFTPTLSPGTQQLCAALQQRSIPEILQRDQEKRRRRLAKILPPQQPKVSATKSPRPSACKPPATGPQWQPIVPSTLDELVTMLLDQQQRMKQQERESTSTA